MIQRFPHQLPPERGQWVRDQSVTRPHFSLLKALFERTGGNSGISSTVGSALTAAGTTQATALVLSNDFNTVTLGSGGVALAALQPGQFMLVFNLVGGNLNVYPASNGQIDALAVNAPYVLANDKTQIYWCEKLLASGGSFYRSIKLG